MRMTEFTEQVSAVSELSPAGELRTVVSPQCVVQENEPLSRRTTLRVGGSADLWVEPATEPDLIAMLQWAGDRGMPVMLLGRGSNLLVRDGGIRGMVICLCQPHFARVEVEGCRVRCGAGARLKAVSNEARNHELAGLEFLEGIPGSVGGALRMNAGAHAGSIFDAVVEVRLLDLHGRVQVMSGAGMEAGYRSCPMLRTHVAVEAVLEGRPEARAAIEQRMKEFNHKRWSSQPAAPSAGCVFKNPDSIPAGRLVEELGLKGARVGGARVSMEHGNFIVTEAGSTAAEVLTLINRIREKARSERGIELETEVQIVGEEADQP
ncbi:MAG: UDP-N-acetylmuramate dehydrogenase [Verrucomicrobia bacterium]|nr:UDP-N-acetylmuramate dehydrogenase [Verrucomicrobiota bacterium]